MTSFASGPPNQEAIAALRDKQNRKYAVGTLIAFKMSSSVEEKPFMVTARVVEDLGNKLHVVVCSMGNDFCKDLTKEQLNVIMLYKINVIPLDKSIDDSTSIGAAAAGGAKKKSRRRKANKTKRKSRRLKRTSKRRA